MHGRGVLGIQMLKWTEIKIGCESRQYTMKRHVDIVQGFVEEQFCDKAAVERGIDWREVPLKLLLSIIY